MKKLFAALIVSLALVSAVRQSAEDAAKPATPPDDTVLIADLRANQPGVFYYGTWSEKVALAKSGLAVQGAKGAQGNGGMGRELEAAQDFSTVTYFEVALGVVPGNEVPEVTIALNDADGTQYAARIPIDHLVPGQPVWLRVKRENFRLNSVEKGNDSQMDWTRVKRWHLQGDWNTHRPMQMIFVALRARR